MARLRSSVLFDLDSKAGQPLRFQLLPVAVKKTQIKKSFKNFSKKFLKKLPLDKWNVLFLICQYINGKFTKTYKWKTDIFIATHLIPDEWVLSLYRSLFKIILIVSGFFMPLTNSSSPLTYTNGRPLYQRMASKQILSTNGVLPKYKFYIQVEISYAKNIFIPIYSHQQS